MADKLQIVEALAESGTRYKETALAMPYILIEDSIKHMNVVHGLRGKEVEGYIDEQGHYKKYKTDWDPEGAQTIKARTLETFHLQYESEFDPEPIMKTCFSKPIDKIPLLTQEMVKKIAIAKMMSISENLNPNIWKGVRDEQSDDALSNFDGFATIIRKERAAGNISLSAGNLVQLGGINEYNAGVKLQMIWKRRNRKIKKADMFIEDSILTMYQDWYRNQNYNNANTDTDGQQYFLRRKRHRRIQALQPRQPKGRRPLHRLLDGRQLLQNRQGVPHDSVIRPPRRERVRLRRSRRVFHHRHRRRERNAGSHLPRLQHHLSRQRDR